jgi:hypothetical protein
MIGQIKRATRGCGTLDPVRTRLDRVGSGVIAPSRGLSGNSESGADTQDRALRPDWVYPGYILKLPTHCETRRRYFPVGPVPLICSPQPVPKRILYDTNSASYRPLSTNRHILSIVQGGFNLQPNALLEDAPFVAELLRISLEQARSL